MANKQLHLKLDLEALTFDDMILIQESGEGQMRLRDVRGLIARFVTDDKGQPLDAEEASKQVGQLAWSQAREVMTEFGNQLNAAMEATLPNGPGRT